MAAYGKCTCFSQQYLRNGLSDLNHFSAEQKNHLLRQKALTQALAQPFITTTEVFRDEQWAAQQLLNGSAGRLQSPVAQVCISPSSWCTHLGTILFFLSHLPGAQEVSWYFAPGSWCHRLNMPDWQNLLHSLHYSSEFSLPPGPSVCVLHLVYLLATTACSHTLLDQF